MFEKQIKDIEVDYFKWIKRKRKNMRRVLVKNKMRLMFGFISTPPTLQNTHPLPYQKDYYL